VTDELFDQWAEALAAKTSTNHRVSGSTIRLWMSHWRHDVTVEQILACDVDTSQNATPHQRNVLHGKLRDAAIRIHFNAFDRMNLAPIGTAETAINVIRRLSRVQSPRAVKGWSAKSVAIFQLGLLRKTSFGV